MQSHRRVRPFELLLVFAAVVGVASPTLAQESIREIISAADRDGDGRIQREEAPIAMLSDFREIDTDRDGSLDSHEIWEFQRNKREQERLAPGAENSGAQGGSPRRVRTFEELVERRDTNGDGRLSLAEAPESAHRAVRQADRDGDGSLDLAEAREADRRRAASSQPDAGGSAGGRSLTSLVRFRDTNGDGLLQSKEAPLRLQRVFDRFDLNGDGAIDREEASAADAAAAGKSQ